MQLNTELWNRVLREPRDLDLRAVLADYLLEHGEPHLGRYLALSVEVERRGPRWEGYPQAHAEAQRLLLDHASTWHTPLRDALGSDRWPEDIDHWAGLPHTVRLPHPLLAERGAALLDAAPVQRFTVQSARTDVRGFRFARHVDLLGDIWADEALEVLRREDLDHLEGFGLFNQLGAGRLAIMLSLLEGVPLQSLELNGVRPARTGARRLAQSPLLPPLTTLGLATNDLRPPDVEALLQATPRLTTLDLSGNPGLAGSIGEHLAASPARPTDLHLRSSFGPSDVDPLLDALGASLDRLFANTPRGELLPRHLERIGTCSATTLELGNARLGPAGMAALCRGGLAQVVHLVVRSNSLTDAGLDALLSADPHRLTTLDLSSNRLTDEGIARLARWPGLRHVTSLDLTNNRRLGIDGVAALVASEWLQPTRLVVDVTDRLRGTTATDQLQERFGDGLVLRY
ncbi:MAG: hypothetical protein KTR31_08985 [Myxococcales bacterium]|nr:hypothetical protein [Myxococcales bacterium]